MPTLTVALDWTPNTNHTGFFVAQELGYYAAADLLVDLLTPAADNYATTPAKQLETGAADFAIAPFESVISLNTKVNAVPAVAVAALLQADISSVAVLKSSGLARPRDLDGRTYASYQARYEDKIVQQLVINDGGAGDLRLSYPPKLGIWETLLTGAADATWIFDNWEGMEAETNGVELTKFRLGDYGIPYGYSPVLLTTRPLLDQHADAYRAFVQATKKGYLFAQANPARATDILTSHVPPRDAARVDIRRSQDYTAPYYGDAATWGTMTEERVAAFLDWLIANKLEDEKIKAYPLFTNELLREA
ncbi:ABC transporter substrate-binding protein [Hymenobacter psoromatis]|uniref:ABC transporter substrate-binding protein n=1 Tax=Hymenobacter psoromatis TaxID=1484116 RepID=UPI001CC08AC9|nr:ABC transporter substrate-binding protein [Hymenobacter psoromatis]